MSTQWSRLPHLLQPNSSILNRIIVLYNFENLCNVYQCVVSENIGKKLMDKWYVTFDELSRSTKTKHLKIFFSLLFSNISFAPQFMESHNNCLCMSKLQIKYLVIQWNSIRLDFVNGNFNLLSITYFDALWICNKTIENNKCFKICYSIWYWQLVK